MCWGWYRQTICLVFMQIRTSHLLLALKCVTRLRVILYTEYVTEPKAILVYKILKDVNHLLCVDMITGTGNSRFSFRLLYLIKEQPNQPYFFPTRVLLLESHYSSSWLTPDKLQFSLLGHLPFVMQIVTDCTGLFSQSIVEYFMAVVNSSHSYATGGTSVSEFW